MNKELHGHQAMMPRIDSGFKKSCSSTSDCLFLLQLSKYQEKSSVHECIANGKSLFIHKYQQKEKIPFNYIPLMCLPMM